MVIVGGRGHGGPLPQIPERKVETKEEIRKEEVRSEIYKEKENAIPIVNKENKGTNKFFVMGAGKMSYGDYVESRFNYYTGHLEGGYTKSTYSGDTTDGSQIALYKGCPLKDGIHAAILNPLKWITIPYETYRTLKLGVSLLSVLDEFQYFDHTVNTAVHNLLGTKTTPFRTIDAYFVTPLSELTKQVQDKKELETIISSANSSNNLCLLHVLNGVVTEASINGKASLRTHEYKNLVVLTDKSATGYLTKNLSVKVLSEEDYKTETQKIIKMIGSNL